MRARAWSDRDQAYARAAGVQTSPLFIVQTARERSEERAMEGESTTLRSEVQVLLDDPANFYNIVMSRSGEAGGGRGRLFSVGRYPIMARGRAGLVYIVSRVLLIIIVTLRAAGQGKASPLACNGRPVSSRSVWDWQRSTIYARARQIWV